MAAVTICSGFGGQKDTHAQRNKILQNNVTLGLCADIFYYIHSTLVHIKDKMMVTRHKIDFLIHWLHQQFDKYYS